MRVWRICLLGLLLLITTASYGQSTFSISGRIQDVSTGGIPGAPVFLYSPDAKVPDRIWQARTDDQGHFEFVDLPAGTYDWTAESPGFRQATTQHLKLVDQSISDLFLVLMVGGCPQCVTVSEIKSPTCWSAGLSGISVAYVQRYDGTNLRGAILESNGSPVAGVSFSIASASVSLQLTSDAHGEFILSSVAPGLYKLAFSQTALQGPADGSFWVTRNNLTRLTLQWHRAVPCRQ
jgi:hypothetical protein